mmetsp:Transcript_13681/g.42324  ORF Transcript_13681/g.42324 Transcript_13681/m.42324 type:complete len:89 (-) Transcript_13681:4877-5143(-)
MMTLSLEKTVYIIESVCSQNAECVMVMLQWNADIWQYEIFIKNMETSMVVCDYDVMLTLRAYTTKAHPLSSQQLVSMHITSTVACYTC